MPVSYIFAIVGDFLPAVQSCVCELSGIVCSAVASHDVSVLSPSVLALLSFYVIPKNPFAFITFFFFSRDLSSLVLI